MNDAATRVLLITRNLPPVIGGMERLIGHVADALIARHETVIVGPRNARFEKPPLAWYACPISPPARFLAAAAWRTRTAARRQRPALVFAGSGLVAPIARRAAHKAGIPWVIYLHGLDIATPQALYRRLFIPAIRGADLVLANSRYTARLAVAAGVTKPQLRVLHPGVAVPESTFDHEEAARHFRECYALPAAGPILLGVGRLTPRKGFADFVARGLPAVLDKIPDAQLVIAGEVPRHAVRRAADESIAIRRAADAAGIAGKVHLIGALDDTRLALAWSAAAVHVFPVRNDPGDPEGFGMVALEAAARGVPTVAFAAGGVPDAVDDEQSGRLIAPDDYPGFASAVVSLAAEQTGEARRLACREFARTFAWEAFDSRLLGLIGALLSERRIA